MSGDAKMSEQLVAIYEQFGVPVPVRDWLLGAGVTSVDKLAGSVTDEASIGPEVIQASGITLNLGDKASIRLAWAEARRHSGTFCGPASAASGTGSGTSSVQSLTKMPTGAESRLRGLWFKHHNFNINGTWLVVESEMAKIHHGLASSPPVLYIPDIASLVRRSELQSTKPESGHMITDAGIETVSFAISPCTTHPEFWLRMRAYIMTICWLSIATPSFLTYEAAVDVCDFIFDAVNRRPDGKRPSIQALTTIYFAMLGEYAKLFQNHSKILEEWLTTPSNWHHLWKESIASYDSAPGVPVSDELAAMHKL